MIRTLRTKVWLTGGPVITAAAYYGRDTSNHKIRGQGGFGAVSTGWTISQVRFSEGVGAFTTYSTVRYPGARTFDYYSSSLLPYVPEHYWIRIAVTTNAGLTCTMTWYP